MVNVQQVFKLDLVLFLSEDTINIFRTNINSHLNYLHTITLFFFHSVLRKGNPHKYLLKCIENVESKFTLKKILDQFL